MLLFMEHRQILNSCSQPHVGRAVEVALDLLFENCLPQLKNDVGERSLTSRLADYLRPHFQGYDVEIEYNRMGKVPKSLNFDGNPELVYPDIIVHRPMTNDYNLLVIELKKSSNPQTKANDVRKLQAFKADLGYQHALFMKLGVRERAGAIVKCEWI